MAKTPSAKPSAKKQTTAVDVSSRISFGAPKTAAVSAPKITKEDAAKSYAEAVLSKLNADDVTVAIDKSGRGKCMLVTFQQPDMRYDITVFVFGGDYISISADNKDPALLFNKLHRTYATVEDAAKFTRLAFFKNKIEQALAVPVKPPRRGSTSTSTEGSTDAEA
jgi:hypothetical protein